MKTADEIYAAFQDRAHRSGGLVFFDGRTALKIVEKCKAEDTAVVGLEGFCRDGEILHPDLSAIGDISREYKGDWRQFVLTGAQAASRLIRKFRSEPNYVFCLDIYSQDEWDKLPAEVVLPTPHK